MTGCGKLLYRIAYFCQQNFCRVPSDSRYGVQPLNQFCLRFRLLFDAVIELLQTLV